MKNLFMLFAVVVSTVFMCSCGNLDPQYIGGKQLSDGQLEFARNMTIEPNWSSMRMSFDNRRNYTDKWNSYAVPVFPVIYWTTLGSFKDDHFFGVRKAASFFPVFYLVNDSVYDAKGARLKTALDFNLALALGYEEQRTPEASEWKFGFLWIPGLGPVLGFGPSFFQFLWIPFSEL
ncbi:MAG: hypothetical protein JXR78_17665 [Victivallales bacterium]|nr:hypothetical protein [Victivallales bacterium]